MRHIPYTIQVKPLEAIYANVREQIRFYTHAVHKSYDYGYKRISVYCLRYARVSHLYVYIHIYVFTVYMLSKENKTNFRSNDK